MDFLRLTFFDAIQDSQTILLAGAGGGYDIFGGLPLYFGLRAAGKTVHLANLSFTSLYGTKGKRIGPSAVEVTYQTEGNLRYFPEKHLAAWFSEKFQENVPIYGIERTGTKSVKAAYEAILNHIGGVDTILLVDGGTDSLMRGDECDLGTPHEDMASICAVHDLEGVRNKLLACIGFGVDTHHGVCHAHFLEGVADLTRQDAFLGAWTVTKEMPEARYYLEAIAYVHKIMFNNPSIVNASILSAIVGHFGNYHATYRTEGSELFINALMALYWTFRLDAVADRCLYLDYIRDTNTYEDMIVAIAKWQAEVEKTGKRREWVSLPM